MTEMRTNEFTGPAPSVEALPALPVQGYGVRGIRQFMSPVHLTTIAGRAEPGELFL